MTREAFRSKYADVFKGDDKWQAVETTDSLTYDWPPTSTYVQNPPYFQGMDPGAGTISDIDGARVLALLGDMVTTDHISPAGSFKDTTPAGRYLTERQVAPREFNSYGSRRGNHEVMMRGTFANIRIRNEMLDGVEGGYTLGPDGEQTSIFDAAMAHKAKGTPLVIFAGEQYGAGSSRDWAAKGTALLGVKAVIAESFERIHRSNLVGMGVIPFEFTGGDTRTSLGLKGDETVSITGLEGDLKPLSEVPCTITYGDGRRRRSRSSAGSIPRSRSSTSRTAACCTTCCGTSLARRDRDWDCHARNRRLGAGFLLGTALVFDTWRKGPGLSSVAWTKVQRAVLRTKRTFQRPQDVAGS